MSLLSRWWGKKNNPTTAPLASTDTAPQALGSVVHEQVVHGQAQAAEAAYAAGRWQEAARWFAALTQAAPDNGQAHFMLGASLLQAGDNTGCLPHLQRAAQLLPHDANCQYSLANTLAATGHFDQAIHHYRQAVSLAPTETGWLLDLAAAQVHTEQSLAALHTWLPEADSRDVVAWRQLGNAFYQHQHADAAFAIFQYATQLPDAAAPEFLMLAACLRDRHLVVEAEAPARIATECGSDIPDTWFMLASILARQARHDEAITFYQRALSLAPHYDAAWRSLLQSMNYSDQCTPHAIFTAHRHAAARFAPVQRPPVPTSHKQSGHRLRIGYLSADFCRHPVACFIRPVLEHHDSTHFDVFCYAVGREDDITPSLRTLVPHWRQLTQCSDETLVNRIAEDDLDILIDLSGHTDGHRLAVMAQRLAPVQMTYLGYPNTTGLDAIDYRITDAIADPPGDADQLHSETLVRLPDVFLCYSPPCTVAPAATTPYSRNNYITFGSFNNFAKLSDSTIRLWASALQAVPTARMLLKTNGLQDPGLRALVFTRFQHAGIQAERIRILEPQDSHDAHFHSYGEMDIALDAFPYHGTTTTLDALWMGVPVVTLAGDRHAARVSASILHAVGLDDLVAHSPEQFSRVAASLATSPERLQTLRQSLRQTLAASPLMNGAAFTHQLEQVYRHSWDAAATAPTD